MQRRTKQAETVLRVLRNTPTHPTVDWIYDQARKKIPRISQGTVYRDLRQLVKEGEIAMLRLGSTSGKYDGRSDPHSHFCCVECGSVHDMDEKEDKAIDESVGGEEITQQVAQSMGSVVLGYQLAFHGICGGCRQS